MQQQQTVPVPYDDFDIASSDASVASDDCDGAYGGSWHSSDGGSSCSSSIEAHQQQRLEWLCRYWTVSDRKFNARLVETADVEFPKGIGDLIPEQLGADDGW